MVKDNFIAWAKDKDIQNHSTEFQVIIELCQKIDDLEKRIVKLEEK